VRAIAARLRFHSFDVVLDQRSLDYGEDIHDFMRDAIAKADAMLVLVTQDYARAVGSVSSAGAGVRFEMTTALSERATRPGFQVIPVLLDGTPPPPPLDTLRCASSAEIDEVAAQLGLARTKGMPSRVLVDRYRIDTQLEARGVTRIYDGWDLIVDAPVEIYQVPLGEEAGRYWYTRFASIVGGWSAAHSPFLLALRDTHFEHGSSFYVITERFAAATLEKPPPMKPLGALLIAYQACLALVELHAAGIIHGGLGPRCVRLDVAEPIAKIVDFEFAVRVEEASSRVELEGYPLIMPPERYDCAPPSYAGDVYQLGCLAFRLLTERWVTWGGLPFGLPPDTLILAEGRAEAQISRTLSVKVRHVAPLLARCLARSAATRPTCAELADALVALGAPACGRLSGGAALFG
jgi:hypothetical protein